MPFARAKQRLLVSTLVFLSLKYVVVSLPAAGVTFITHGNIGDTEGWVTGMADAVSDRFGGNVPVYRLQVTDDNGSLTTSLTKVAGGAFQADPSGQLIIMLDWRPPVADGNSYTTLEVADAVAPLFAQTNAVPDLAGHAIAELPLHLVGHSRGGSLVSELSRLLGNQGIWIDHLTGLDTHPLNNDGFNDFIYAVVDPSVETYENVLFAECYYQTAAFFADGLQVPGATWRQLTEFDGGYDGIDSSHSDVHLWYHGTIDLETPTSDVEASITSTMRATWWSAFEQAGTNAGFIYTYHGGGNRLSTAMPNGANSSAVHEGFNRYYDLGDGILNNNRTALAGNSGEWPNPIRFELVTTNEAPVGSVARFGIHLQWGQPTNLTHAVAVYADTDRNPLNGNETLMEEGMTSGTTAARIGTNTIDVHLDGSLLTAGQYEFMVRLTGNGRSRYLYSPQSIILSAPAEPFTLDIAGGTDSFVTIGVNGEVDQTAVLEASIDSSPWIPFATNTFTSNRWETVVPIDPEVSQTLIRARMTNP